MRWAGTVVWATERGARVAGAGLGAPHPSGERLLHRLVLADVGLRQGAAGHIVLTEREVRTAEATPGRATELLADHGVPGVHDGARGEPVLAVRAGVRAVHWPDLVLVLPGDGIAAVEVELTPKTPSALWQILRAYGTPAAGSRTSAPAGRPPAAGPPRPGRAVGRRRQPGRRATPARRARPGHRGTPARPAVRRRRPGRRPPGRPARAAPLMLDPFAGGAPCQGTTAP